MPLPRPWSSFAHDPADPVEVRAEKLTVFIVAGSCCTAGVVWALVYAVVLGWGLTAALPLAFVAIVGSGLVLAHRRRQHLVAVYAEIVCIIGITALIQWTFDDAFDSGVVLVWAFIGPMTALLFRSVREAAVWLVVYLAVVAVTIVIDPVLGAEPLVVSADTRRAFLGMNLGVASIVVFAFAGYFVRQALDARGRADRLLLNVLPAEIAPRLKESSATIADRHESASVLFADIVGSTPLFAELAPEEAVDWLNEVFSAFDQLVERHGLEKIRTIGDNYMVAAGVPSSRDDHAVAICRLGLDMIECLGRTPARNGRQLEFRIGINSGPLVAGVIGTHRFHYDVWGDTVNIASRMESHGEVGRVHITDATRALVAHEVDCERRGTIELKGRGSMETWFLVPAGS